MSDESNAILGEYDWGWVQRVAGEAGIGNYPATREALHWSLARIGQLEAERDRLREALTFYAKTDLDSWGPDKWRDPNVPEPRNGRARAVLAETVPNPEPQWSTCIHCGGRCHWQECPTGGWWIHEHHPTDDHDAAVPIPEGDDQEGERR